MDITQNETFIFILRIGGALLTLGAAVELIVLGRVLGSPRLNKILYALIGFFAAFALLRMASGFLPVFYALIAANLLFLSLDIALGIQARRLKRAAPTEKLQKERAGAIDDAMALALAIKKEMPR